MEKANDSPYGPNASIRAGDEALGQGLGTRLQYGRVNVDEAHAAAWGSADVPMGGLSGNSGVGRRYGAHVIQKYTEPQTVAVQRVLPVTAPLEMGAERYARIVTAALKALFRIPGF